MISNMPITYLDTLLNKYTADLPAWKHYDEIVKKKNSNQPLTAEEIHVYQYFMDNWIDKVNILKLQDTQMRFYIDEILDHSGSDDVAVVRYLLAEERYPNIIMETYRKSEDNGIFLKKSFFDLIIEKFYARPKAQEKIIAIFQKYREANNLVALEQIFKNWGATPNDLDLLFFRKDKIEALIKSFPPDSHIFDVAEATRCTLLAKNLYPDFSEYSANLYFDHIEAIPRTSLFYINGTEALYLPKADTNGLVIIHILDTGDSAHNPHISKIRLPSFDPKTTYVMLGGGYAKFTPEMIGNFIQKYVTQYNGDSNIKKIIVYYSGHGDEEGNYIKPVIQLMPQNPNLAEKVIYIIAACYSEVAMDDFNPKTMGQLVSSASKLPTIHSYGGQDHIYKTNVSTTFNAKTDKLFKDIISDPEHVLYQILDYAGSHDVARNFAYNVKFLGYVNGKLFERIPAAILAKDPIVIPKKEMKLKQLFSRMYLKVKTAPSSSGDLRLREALMQAIAKSDLGIQIDLQEFNHQPIKELLAKYELKLEGKIALYHEIVSGATYEFEDLYTGKEEGYNEITDYLIESLDKSLNSGWQIADLVTIHSTYDPPALKIKPNFIKLKQHALNKISTMVEAIPGFLPIVNKLVKYWVVHPEYITSDSVNILNRYSEYLSNKNIIFITNRDLNEYSSFLYNIDLEKIKDVPLRQQVKVSRDNLTKFLSTSLTQQVKKNQNGDILVKDKPLILMSKIEMAQLINLLKIVRKEDKDNADLQGLEQDIREHINKFSNTSLAKIEASKQVINMLRQTDSELYAKFIRECRENLNSEHNQEEILKRFEDKGSIDFKLIDQTKKIYEVYLYDEQNKEIGKFTTQAEHPASLMHEFIKQYHEFMPEHFRI